MQNGPGMGGKAQELANARFKDMAARHGELSMQKALIEEEQADLMSKMRALNDAVPFALQVEGATVEAVVAAQAEAEAAKKKEIDTVVAKMGKKNEQREAAPSNS